MESVIKDKTGLYKKLLIIQQKVVGLGKDKKSNTYSYVTGDKVLGEIKPLMNSLGLLLKQEVTDIENTRMDYKTGIGTTYEKPKSEILSKVMMRFTWIDTETGETDINLFGANGQNDWEKGLGSALTYAERYFLLKYFHIETDEDDIDNDSRKKTEPIATVKQETTASNNYTASEISNAEIMLKTATNLKDLETKYLSLTVEMRKYTLKTKDELKAKLTPKTN
jgi:hypothetical protein